MNFLVTLPELLGYGWGVAWPVLLGQDRLGLGMHG